MEIVLALILVLLLFIIWSTTKKCREDTFKVARDCAPGDIDCLNAYGSVSTDLPPRTSMGGGGLLKSEYHKFKPQF